MQAQGVEGGSEVVSAAELEREIARRRTFAIISHPDAGKTTLTEKLLLYGIPSRRTTSVMCVCVCVSE